MKVRCVGILVFPGVELLDFAGPFEVFSAARRPAAMGDCDAVFAQWRDSPRAFDVFTVAKRRGVIETNNGLRIEATHDFTTHPNIDILVVPGGAGIRTIIDDRQPDEDSLAWIREVSSRVELTSSVCTGAWALARAGLLRNRSATTHFLCLDLLAEIDSSIRVVRDARIVDDGVITSAGVAAGIDMALHVVERFCGERIARATARYIEYPYCRAPGSGQQKSDVAVPVAGED